MLRNSVVLCAASLVALALAPLSPAAAAAYRVETGQTHIDFAIGAKGYPVTRGEFHRFNASVAIDAAAPAKSQVAFDVAAASIDTHAPLLDDYVRGAGFLDTAHHPGIAFHSTTVRQMNDRTVELAGNLSLLGVTRPETFRVTVTPEGTAFRLVAQGEIRRSDFGMTGGLPLVSDTVTITVSTLALAQ
ncbi:YceI family protein [Xanthobacter autotrophicus]|jgi:polyisoprenoid-binding protein YceI|uniref:YceI family protein n=1 Tax=Xanthobacter autotrophicus TaxID=280 RepID=A0A6C1KKP6_XANAU|nr:YceI family protein [Xanthobacter autotrophicus]TLX44217.1 YceI family protein [Xanthobacter autotrophicus]